ncbi:MAG: iron uptake transporter permease EfeU [Streptosporangiaceae bacterium]
MFANYLIGLREGLEASLVVTILVAYLVKSGHRRGLVPLWVGIVAAVLLSLGFGGLLALTSSQLSFTAQEAFGGFMSIFAVALVTWMIFWMRRTARFMKTELEGKLDDALAVGSVAALVAVAFLSVGREGLETALFLWTNIRASGDSLLPIVGALLGITTAIVLAYLLYRRSVRLNLARFFTWTGAILIVIAAGVFAYGFHELQEAALLPGEHAIAFDASSAIPPTSWYGTVLGGVFSFNPSPSWVELAAWLIYLLPVMVLFLRPARPPAPAPARA